MLHLFVLENRTLPSVYSVTSLADHGPGSLRQVLADAQSTGGDNAITFAVTGTVTLESSLPELSTNLMIEGPGPGGLTVQRDSALGTPDFSILTIDANATVTISGMTLTGGGRSLYGGGVFNNGGTLTVNNCAIVGNTAWRGGGILNFGSLTVSASTFARNTATDSGGGIANFGPLVIDHSTLTYNSGGDGGAVYNFAAASLAIQYSTLSSNAATFGGAIGNNGGTVTVDSSTVVSNIAATGGGLDNPYGGTATISDSTFTGNTATYTDGGAIANDIGAVLGVFNSTIARNVAPSGGGIANAGTMTARDTLLAQNQAPSGADLSGDLGSLGHNLIANAEGGSGYAATDLLDIDPLLGPLQDNGGPTLTMAILPGSPAIGAGDKAGHPRWDERGHFYRRVVNHHIDIGAFEVQNPAPSASSHAPEPTVGKAATIGLIDGALPVLDPARAAPVGRGVQAPPPAVGPAAIERFFAAADRQEDNSRHEIRMAIHSVESDAWVDALALGLLP